jgi:nucleoside-triphosphatase
VRLTVVAGPRDSGKTRKAAALAEELRQGGASVGGVLSLGIFSGGIKTGYEVLDLATGERAPLMAEDFSGPGFAWRRFRFSSAGIAFAEAAVRRAQSLGVEALFLDEVGRAELEGLCFAPLLRELLSAYRGRLVLCVRDCLLDEVAACFGLPPGFELLAPA